MSLRKIGVPLLAMAVFLILWELLVWLNGWPNYIMASPSDLPASFIRFWDLFLIMGWQTLWRTVLGLLIAIVFGAFVLVRVLYELCQRALFLTCCMDCFASFFS